MGLQDLEELEVELLEMDQLEQLTLEVGAEVLILSQALEVLEELL